MRRLLAVAALSIAAAHSEPASGANATSPGAPGLLADRVLGRYTTMSPAVAAGLLGPVAQPRRQGPVGDSGETRIPHRALAAGGPGGHDGPRGADAAGQADTTGGSAPGDVANVVLNLHAGQQLARAAGQGAAPAALEALRFALAHLGDQYVWGATGPTTWDCSGLVQAAYRSAGIALPRVAADQAGVGQAVDVANLLPGDLVFFASGTTRQSVHHVALYLGNGLVVQAPHTGAVVDVSPIWFDDYAGAVRVATGVGAGLTAVLPHQKSLSPAPQPVLRRPARSGERADVAQRQAGVNTATVTGSGVPPGTPHAAPRRGPVGAPWPPVAAAPRRQPPPGPLPDRSRSSAGSDGVHSPPPTGHRAPAAQPAPTSPAAAPVSAMPAPVVGETLHAQVSTAGASPASTFRWQRCVLDVCTTIAGEHTADLHLTVADLHQDPGRGDP